MLANVVKMEDWLSVDDIEVPLRQRALSHKNEDACYNSFIATTSDILSCALPLSTAISHADDWLSLVPSTALGFHFHSQEFCLSDKYSLGFRIIDEHIQ